MTSAKAALPTARLPRVAAPETLRLPAVTAPCVPSWLCSTSRPTIRSSIQALVAATTTTEPDGYTWSVPDFSVRLEIVVPLRIPFQIVSVPATRLPAVSVRYILKWTGVVVVHPVLALRERLLAPTLF